MPSESRIVIIVPARLASERLPNKPLAEIGGRPMIEHVWRRGMEAQLGDVVVAAADQEICDAIEGASGRAVMTDPAHPSGSDRIFEALQKIDPDRQTEFVINLQGDLPLLDPQLIRATVDVLNAGAYDMSTLAAPIEDEAERTDPNVVKAVAAFPSTSPQTGEVARALYFSRATVPYGEGPHFHHIGLYGYRRAALEKFVGLPPSPLEQREKLEQLRALENGLQIGVGLVDSIPFGVDTPADLEKARQLMK